MRFDIQEHKSPSYLSTPSALRRFEAMAARADLPALAWQALAYRLARLSIRENDQRLMDRAQEARGRAVRAQQRITAPRRAVG